ncbi:glycosyltransferase family 1 protein [Micromonospora sp. WMMC241]|uniref:glycosyltransferase n=1 Tax=Micromonospora sp. WMMC241 TaxID=3015159 RepID=UPI0022B60E70|nr:glycosyltransferase family 1 protein [Micromonospora sp. WMMC241]MCZ7438615.1 glycosyltransferase family 1 protein [Micromonospora sp. WMMC241]
MSNVLLVTGVSPQAGILSTAVQRLRETGAQVYLVGALNQDEMAEDLRLDGVCALPTDIAKDSPTRALARQVPGERVWSRIRREPWAREQARTADVLVALDAHAVYTVWRFAQRNRSADARYGIQAAVQALTDRKARHGAGPLQRLANGIPSTALVRQSVNRLISGAPRAAVNAVTARPIMRSKAGTQLWLTALKAPKMPDSVRTKVARQVAKGMAWADRPDGEAMVLTATASKLRKPAARARMLGEAASRELKAGVPPRDLDGAVEALLKVADQRHRADENVAAADLLNRAMTLAFDRVLHIDQLTSPLAEDPEGFIAPFRRSLAATTVASPRGRLQPAAPPPTDRPLRLLIATSANDNFLKLIRSYYDAHPGVEVRFVDLAANAALKSVTWASKPMLEHRLSADSTAYGDKAEERLRPYLDWADTVFVDWCVAPAALFTMVDPGTTRIIVRLHSYEALSRWPYMVDFSRIDDLVFVADHIRDLTTTLVPYLKGPDGPRMHVLDNAMDLRGFQIDKPAEARFQLGMVGISQVAKDPRWAIEVLRLLRKRDERYRLLLVGGDMNPNVSVASRDYLEAFNRDVREFEADGAVRRLGPTNEVPKMLSDIGVIISSSVREGCHCGLMEGAASGAVPVVRDWPFFAGRPNSARTLYPDGWVIGSPEEAVERILATTGTEEAWRAAGRDASAYALREWDWSVVQHHFDRLLLES